MKKKVVWLCSYGDNDKWNHVKRWHDSRIRSYGSWIPDLLRGFYNDPDYEIHVVSFTGLQCKRIVSWSHDGVYFHSYRAGCPILGYQTPKFELLFNYLFNRLRIYKIIKEIDPDLIHLFGSENDNYSSALLRLSKSYKVIQFIQGFKCRDIGKMGHLGFAQKVMLNRRLKIEQKVLNIGNCFIAEPESLKFLSTLRDKNFRSYHAYFPINEMLAEELNKMEDISLKYDLIYLARMCKQKGIVDFVRIAKAVKEALPTARIAVAGTNMLQDAFRSLCNSIGIDPDLIEYRGFLANQIDVYEMMHQAKVYALPTYNDCFPTTIRECMYLRTAVVAYETGGIPYVNEKGRPEFAALIKQGDWRAMADKILFLLKDDTARDEMIARAYIRAKEKFSLEVNVETIRQAYKDTLGGE